MSLQELGHPEGLDLLLPKDRLQLLVGGEEPSVLGVLELVLFQVGPQTLHNLSRGTITRFKRTSFEGL